MTKKELIANFKEECEVTGAKADEYVNTLFNIITSELAKGEEVVVSGFGKFVVKDVAARKGVNPQTKEVIDIPASKKVSFKPEKKLKEAVK